MSKYTSSNGSFPFSKWVLKKTYFKLFRHLNSYFFLNIFQPGYFIKQYLCILKVGIRNIFLAIRRSTQFLLEFFQLGFQWSGNELFSPIRTCLANINIGHNLLLYWIFYCILGICPSTINGWRIRLEILLLLVFQTDHIFGKILHFRFADFLQTICKTSFEFSDIPPDFGLSIEIKSNKCRISNKIQGRVESLGYCWTNRTLYRIQPSTSDPSR